MGYINKSTIGYLQEATLEQQIQDLRSGLDFNYKGYSRFNSGDPFLKTGNAAVINRVMLWLCSKPNDYIRQSSKGGILYSLIATHTTDIDLQYWEREIKNQFNNDFAASLTLLYFQMSVDKFRKILTLKMIVQDNLTRAVIPVATGVSI